MIKKLLQEVWVQAQDLGMTTEAMAVSARFMIILLVATSGLLLGLIFQVCSVSITIVRSLRVG